MDENSVIGRRFVEWTMPELVHQIKRLNDNIETLNNNAEKGLLSKDSNKDITCIECDEIRIDENGDLDARVQAGMKCGVCAYG